MPTFSPPELPNRAHLTPQEIAVFLHVGIRTIYRLVAEENLPHVRWSATSVIRIPRAEFLAWVAQHGHQIM